MGPTMKYLVVLVVVAVVVWMLTARARGGRSATPPESKAPSKPRKGAVAPPLQMVVCAHCGLHLPEADALLAGERHYCCEAHRALGPPR